MSPISARPRHGRAVTARGTDGVLPGVFSCLLALTLVAFLAGGAHAQDEAEPPEPQATSDTAETDSAAAVDDDERPTGYGADFVREAATEWLVLHRLGHALAAEFDLDMDEASIDGFASTRLLQRHDGTEGAERLAATAQALLAAKPGVEENEAGMAAMHGLEVERAFRIACIVNGSDEDVAAEFSQWAGVPRQAYDACGSADRDIQTEAWDVALGNALLFDDEPPLEVSVRFEEAGELAAARTWLAESGLMEATADEIARTYAFVDPVELVARSCEDEPFEPVPSPITICYETIAAVEALAEASEMEAGPGRSVDGAPAEPVAFGEMTTGSN